MAAMIISLPVICGINHFSATLMEAIQAILTLITDIIKMVMEQEGCVSLQLLLNQYIPEHSGCKQEYTRL